MVQMVISDVAELMDVLLLDAEISSKDRIHVVGIGANTFIF